MYVKKSVGLASQFKDYFCVQFASLRPPRRVQCFCPYSTLDFFKFAMASPSKICLDSEQNHYIKNLDYSLGWQ